MSPTDSQLNRHSLTKPPPCLATVTTPAAIFFILNGQASVKYGESFQDQFSRFPLAAATTSAAIPLGGLSKPVIGCPGDPSWTMPKASGSPRRRNVASKTDPTMPSPCPAGCQCSRPHVPQKPSGAQTEKPACTSRARDCCQYPFCEADPSAPLLSESRPGFIEAQSRPGRSVCVEAGSPQSCHS